MYSLLGKKKAWNSTVLLKAILVRLAQVFAPWKETHEIVLMMDAVKIHCRKDVWDVCIELNIKLLIIPALATCVLHPLDTHVFARLKATLK